LRQKSATARVTFSVHLLASQIAQKYRFPIMPVPEVDAEAQEAPTSKRSKMKMFL
jgi:hypothetical protein